MKMKRVRIPLAVVAAMVFLVFSSPAMAAHPTVTTLQADGVTAAGGTSAYSPKQTCGGCHFDCSTGAYTTDTTKWCQSAATKKNCSTYGNCPDYESAATTTITKYEGAPGSGAAFNVSMPMHGASTGKHSTEGRNEELTADQKKIWGLPPFTTGTGMSGRY